MLLENETMSIALDKSLIFRTKRNARPNGLSEDERMAMRWFWNEGVKVPVIAKVFGVSKNTVYYKSLTGDADSYPNTRHSNSAAEAKKLFDELGADGVRRRFVSDKMIRDINAELAREAARMKK
jgi:hypothetical protein